MTHSLLISLVILSTFLCSLVNGEEEIKQTSTFTDSEKPSKLGELLQKLQAAKEALERERLLEQVSKDDANLYEYLRENLGTDSADLPIMPPRMKPYYTQPETARDELWSGQNKRGNYMTLCHFKICNMGRKRWKSWP